MEGKGNPASATVYLDKLAEELTSRGFEAWLMAPPGRVPSVYITNPGARALEENVYANQGKDGLWWFWWSWAERISIADDLDSDRNRDHPRPSLPRRRLTPSGPGQASGHCRGSATVRAAPREGPVRRGLHRLGGERAQGRAVDRDHGPGRRGSRRPRGWRRAFPPISRSVTANGSCRPGSRPPGWRRAWSASLPRVSLATWCAVQSARASASALPVSIAPTTP